MSATERVYNLIGMDSVKNEVEGWNVLSKCSHPSKQTVSQNYLIPLASGAGRTTITREITGVLKELRLFSFASAVPFLEVKPESRQGQVKRIFEQIRSEAIITNEFKGLVAVDLSAYYDNYYTAEFNEFLDQTRYNDNNILFVFFTQRLSDEKTTELLSRLQTIGNIKLLPTDEFSDKDLLTFALRRLEKKDIAIEEAAVEELQKAIKTVRKTQGFAYFKSIDKLIADIQYSIGKSQDTDFYIGGVVSKNDLCGYLSNDLKQYTVSETGTRKLGF